MSKKKMAGSFCSPWLSRTCVYALLLLFLWRFANMRLFLDKCLNNRFFLCVFSQK